MKKKSLGHGMITEEFLKRIDMTNSEEHTIDDVYAPVKRYSFTQDEIYSTELYNDVDYVEKVEEKTVGSKILKVIWVALGCLIVTGLLIGIAVLFSNILG